MTGNRTGTLPPRLNVSGLIPHRRKIGRAVVVEHQWESNRPYWRAQEFARYPDGWDAVTEPRDVVEGLTRLLAESRAAGVLVTFARPRHCPVTSRPSTRDRIVRCSLENATGRAALPPHREEVVI